MFAKMKKGAIGKAMGEAKNVVVTNAKHVTKQVKKELQQHNNNKNSNSEAKPMMVLPAAPPMAASEPDQATTASKNTSTTVANEANKKASSENSQNTTTTPESEKTEASPNTTLTKGTDLTNGVVDEKWSKLLLQYINEQRAQRDPPGVPIQWSDCIYQLCLDVAKDNAETGQNGYGNGEEQKKAMLKVHKAYRGRQKVTTQTMDLTNQGSVDEALQNLRNSQGHWGFCMNPDNTKGAVAAVQKGNTVYWMGMFIKLWPNRSDT